MIEEILEYNRKFVEEKAYEPYVTAEYYEKTYSGRIIPGNELDKALRQASRHVDSLTYNRIVGIGFNNLTPFQQPSD